MKQERLDPGWAWTGKLNISGYGEFGSAAPLTVLYLC